MQGMRAFDLIEQETRTWKQELISDSFSNEDAHAITRLGKVDVHVWFGTYVEMVPTLLKVVIDF